MWCPIHFCGIIKKHSVPGVKCCIKRYCVWGEGEAGTLKRSNSTWNLHFLSNRVSSNKKGKDLVKAASIKTVWYWYRTEIAVNATELRVQERHFIPNFPTRNSQLSLISQSPNPPGSRTCNLSHPPLVPLAQAEPQLLVSLPLTPLPSSLLSTPLPEVSKIDLNMPVSEGTILSLSQGPYPSPQNANFS